MDAVEYLKTFHKLCKSQDSCSGCISGCPLLNEEDGYCIADISERAKEAVQIVEQWGNEHLPDKTRQSEFLKKFPDARVEDDGILDILPCCIEESLCDKCGSRNCGYCRHDYWLEEVDN